MVEESLLKKLTSRTSNWYKLKRIVATMLKWRCKIKKITVDDLQKAELCIIRLVQQEVFKTEMKALKDGKCIPKNSCLYSLDAFLDEQNVLRVGGRLRRSSFDTIIHPIVLPKSHNISLMISNLYHANIGHPGRGITLNNIRSNGYWIIGANSMVKRMISRCVGCKILRGKSSTQKMADLPSDRLEAAPPFIHCAVDMFGPFFVKEGRKQLKRYAALFTCLASRAIHIESTCNLDTDSFIQCLRRFIARRGEIRLIRSDQGSNFVGANNELKKALRELDEEKISAYLLGKGADWVSWKKNPPASSHMGGVWERQIRSARSILNSLLLTHCRSLDDESFRTILTEVESIVNSRPLTIDTLSDVNSPLPLTPNHLLTQKSKVIMPPPGVFQRADLYCRKRWRRVQHIITEFWDRWRKEYLQSLQSRHKWQQNQRNFKINDVILLKESDHRNDWKMGRIIKVNSDDKGIVRSATLKLKDNQILERPITKFVLLVESDDM